MTPTDRRDLLFCASVADVFEDREDLDPWRIRLFDLIRETPSLDWLLLTKRPKVALRYAGYCQALDNIWLGVSVEDQRAANERIPILLEIPAAVRFLSMEPLLAPVRLDMVLDHRPKDFVSVIHALEGSHGTMGGSWTGHRLDWVIVGGESGHHARPMHPGWARSIRDQCVSAGVPFFFKQWGEWAPRAQAAMDVPLDASLAERAHQFEDGAWTHHIGKKSAGRLLDGRTYDEFPTPWSTP